VAGPWIETFSEAVERAQWLRGHADILIGWWHAKSGALDEGLARMRSGRTATEQIHDRMWRPLYVLCEAELLVENARCEEALAVLDECDRLIAALGQSYVLPEVHRQRGVAAGAAGAPLAAVEMELQTALRLAQRQDLRFYELRAATSLTRAWMRAGRTAAAKTLLPPVLAKFAESHDTADVLEAEALLEQLASGRSAAASGRSAPAKEPD